MGKIWQINRADEGIKRKLVQDADVSPIMAEILVNRGIRDAPSCRKFLHPSPEDLYDPLSMRDMAKALGCIRKSVSKGEGILVSGDSDTDGVISTVILMEALRELGAKVSYYIPTDEEYGMNKGALKEASLRGVKVVVTVDCGVTDFEKIDYARSLGMEVIITDHHETRGHLPRATAILNPKREDDTYPFRYLAGAGVAFKLIQGLLGADGARKYLDVVAFATVADIAPLVDENRIIVRYGLESLPYTERPGMKVLLQKIGAPHPTARDVLWALNPILNAPTRGPRIHLAVDLLTAEDDERAERVFDELLRLSEALKAEKEEMLAEFEREAENQVSQGKKAIIIVAPKCRHEIIGSIANQITYRFFRPTFILVGEEDKVVGSSRSAVEVNLVDLLGRSRELLGDFGGHKGAAGFNLPRENLGAFLEKLSEDANTTIPDDALVPRLNVDAVVDPSEISQKFLEELKGLEPTGHKNKEPILSSFDLEVVNIERRSDDTLLTLRGNRGPILKAILPASPSGFAPGGFARGERVDIAYKISPEGDLGNHQLLIEDIIKR
ncbi:MAG: single-stranded-DNA-specific exonuclease RecJ [bacterium]